MKEEERYYLRFSEWFLTGSLLLFLASLVTIAKIKAYGTGEPLKKKLVTVEVVIDGHVEKPGVYAVIRGTPLGELIKKAQPKKFADLRAFSLKEPVASPLELIIKPLEQLAIRVEGAVKNPGTTLVAPGTKISDLKKILPLTPQADLSYFKKRKLLQDGEIVKIPSRKD